jgi:hypothetical protein
MLYIQLHISSNSQIDTIYYNESLLKSYNKIKNNSDLKNSIGKFIICSINDKDMSKLLYPCTLFENEIISHINSHSKFVLFLEKIPNLQQKLLESNLSLEVKFGRNNFGYEQIIDTLKYIDLNQYNLNKIQGEKLDEYQTENCLRLIDTFNHITNDNQMKNFVEIFKFDDNFKSIYDLNKNYIDAILTNTIQFENVIIGLKYITLIKDDCDDLIEKIKKIDIDDHTNTTIYLLQHLITIKLFDESIVNDFLSIILEFHVENINNNTISQEDLEFTINTLLEYKSNKEIQTKIFKFLLKLELKVKDITKIFTEQPSLINIFYGWANCDIIHDKTLINILDYIQHINPEIFTMLLSTYSERFIQTNTINLTRKLISINNATTDLDYRMIYAIFEKIQVRDEYNTHILYDIINKFNIELTEKLINIYPELIHTNKLKSYMIDKIIFDCIDNYDMFNIIINFNKPSDNIINKMTDIYKEKDNLLYIELLLKFNINSIPDNDKIQLIENSKSDILLFKLLISANIFTSDREIVLHENFIGDYSITMLEPSYIQKYITQYTIDDFKKVNKFNNPRLFAFLNNSSTINILCETFDIKLLAEIKDITNNSIYNKMIDFNIEYEIPKEFALQKDCNGIYNIMSICKASNTDTYLYDILKCYYQTENKVDIMEIKDLENNTLMHFMCVYKPNVLLKLIKNNIISKIQLDKYLSFNNKINENPLMYSIRLCQDESNTQFIKYILNNIEIKPTHLFVNYTSGSVLTYALKYNLKIFSILAKPEIINNLLLVRDYVTNIIEPYSDYAKSGKINLNILHIGALYSNEALKTLFTMNKKYLNQLMKEIIIINDNKYNLLKIALFNNPESVQVILNYVGCDESYLSYTESLIEKYENVINIQPASWYYLLQSKKLSDSQLKLNTDEHWYGYVYKNKFKKDTIKTICHYILDKQELPTQTSECCDICSTYKRKVIFTKCRHKVCITCAFRTDKCGTCRLKLTEEEKLLM